MSKTSETPDNVDSTTESTSTTNTSSQTKTNTLILDINSLLNDDDITDISLIPENNGGDTSITSVPAIKAILAARSPVFRRMLYGEFRETQSNNQENVVEVKLDYSGRVLQLLVEFCFTDSLSSLESKSTSTTDSSNNNNFTLEEKSRLLTNLSDAAHYFDIPKLELDIQEQLSNMMLEHPSLACAVLDESSKMASGDTLAEAAFSQIRARPKAALLHWDGGGNKDAKGFDSLSITETDTSNPKWGECGGVIALSATLLESVIFDDQSTACEFTKFKCLQKWVEGCKHEVTKADIEYVELPRKCRPNSVGTADEILSSRTPRLAQSEKKHIDSNGSLLTLGSSDSGMGATSPLPPPSIPSSGDFIGNIHLGLGTHPASTSSSPPPSSKAQNDDMSMGGGQQERRLAIAQHLAEKLDLSLIPASDLSTTINDSQLVPAHALYQAYRLQALNAERTKSKVFVEGAGLAEVNGTYIQRGVHEGTPMYNKEGIWRDREETFRIFLCTYSNGNKSWCLSIVPKGKEPGKTTDLDFYECPVSYGKGGGITSSSYGGSSENGLGVVPSRGWKLVNYGQPPVPKCSLIAGCLEDA